MLLICSDLAAGFEAGTFTGIFQADWIVHFLNELESNESITHEKKDVKYARCDN